MDKEMVVVFQGDTEILNSDEYTAEPAECFEKMPEVAEPLLNDAKRTFDHIEQLLYVTPELLNFVKANIPDTVLQAVLTGEQREQLAKGTLKLLTKKDGSLMASLVNPETKKIVANIPLKSVKMSPELTRAISSYSMQMQMAQIAKQIQAVQIAVEEVRQGQEFDRLAMAYSCQQKLIQAALVKNPEIKKMLLLQLVASAEESRNLLMLSQKNNIGFITEQPESFFGKIISGASPEQIDARMNEIRDSLCAVNMVSFVEAMAYQELDEEDAARKSLEYYGDFIKKTYLDTTGLVERLDLIDPSPKNYWSKTLPDIQKRIEALPCCEETVLIGAKDNED